MYQHKLHENMRVYLKAGKAEDNKEIVVEEIIIDEGSVFQKQMGNESK